MTLKLDTNNMEDIKKFVLSCIASSPEDYERLEEKTKQWDESKRQGAALCKEINEFLVKKDGIKFKSSVDRLYFNDDFSFEAVKSRNKENSLDVWIRIKPRHNDGDVQPNLLNAVAAFEIGDQTKELKLDAFGEGVLKNLEPDVICRFISLAADFVPRAKVSNVIKSEDVEVKSSVDRSIPNVERLTADQAKKLAEIWRQRNQNMVILGADPTNKSSKITYSFYYGDVLMEAKIESSQGQCYVTLTTETDEFAGNKIWLVFRNPRYDQYTTGGFTFERNKESFIAEGRVEIEYSDDVEILSDEIAIRPNASVVNQ